MAAKRFNRQNALTVICAAILVGTEIIAAALALGWALGGLTGMGEEFTIGLIVACLLAGIYVTYRFVRGAAKIEPLYD
ncbi:MAG: hypothetical protein LCH38_00725 [Proteobacteria bacterium]|nr:hypothetical protein [Pseudomonadota bacterium]